MLYSYLEVSSVETMLEEQELQTYRPDFLPSAILALQFA